MSPTPTKDDKKPASPPDEKPADAPAKRQTAEHQADDRSDAKPNQDG